MLFPAALTEARFIRRYKRFFADMELADGSVVTAHCANPGAMLGLLRPGARAFLSRSTNPARKLAWTWELVEIDAGGGPELVGIHTGLPNVLAAEAIIAGRFPALVGYETLRREVKYGRASRIDLLLESPGRPPCYVEVKNVHLMREPGLAEFPDCVTARGAKHLDELAEMVAQGARAVMLFVVQMRAQRFGLARDLDPAYAQAFWRARAQGVETVVGVCRVKQTGIEITGEIKLVAP